jgi:hypothetical protein
MTAPQSPIFAPADPATQLYSEIYSALSGRWQETLSFRKVAELGLPSAAREAELANTGAAEEFLNDSENDLLFLSKQGFIDYVGGAAGVGKTMTAAQLGAFCSAVDAASLVFVHSAVDAAVSDLCRLAALIAPNDWMPWLNNATLSLAEAKARPIDELISAKLASLVERLDREALLFRVDRLFAICQPPVGFAPLNDYTYDRARVEQLDKLRQSIVHRPESARAPIPDCEDSLRFLFRTGLFLWSMLNAKYGVRMDPLHDLKRSKAVEYAFHAMR